MAQKAHRLNFFGRFLARPGWNFRPQILGPGPLPGAPVPIFGFSMSNCVCGLRPEALAPTFWRSFGHKKSLCGQFFSEKTAHKLFLSTNSKADPQKVYVGLVCVLTGKVYVGLVCADGAHKLLVNPCCPGNPKKFMWVWFMCFFLP